MILVDTSAWISFLRGDGSPADRALADLLTAKARLFTTDGIVMELLAGAPDDKAALRLAHLLGSLERCAPADPLDIEGAARLHRASRGGGPAPISLSVCLIATLAVRDGLEVLATDPAFQRLARRAAPDLRIHRPSDPPSRARRHDEVDADPEPVEPEPRSVEPGPASDPGTRPTVLVVEDDASVASMVEGALRRPDRDLVLVASGHAARQKIRERRPDVIVLDLILPDEDGRNLLADLRRDPQAREAAVVVLTGRTGPRTREECFGLGADDFLSKPFDPSQLTHAVEHALVAGRAHGPGPDPLREILTLSEIDKLRIAMGPGSTTQPSSVVLIEVDSGISRDPRDDSGPSGSETTPPLLPHLLRRTLGLLNQELDEGEYVARWGVDQFVIVSPHRGTKEFEAVIQRLTEVPSLGPYLSGVVRRVGKDEDLLDAVSRMVASLVELEEESDADPGARHPAAPRGRPRAALVEDDPVTAGLVQHRLERSGFLVEHFTDGARALDAILSTPPGVVILDVQLPSMDGFEILGRMRTSSTAGDVPVLMFTSLGREEHVQRAFDLGADDYVTKPFSPSELLARVLRLIRRR